MRRARAGARPAAGTLVLTFCADSHRTRSWLALRGARLGICYMGTTLFAMRGIADLLELPDNVLPVTSLVVGWPDEAPPQRDRLPATAWIHDERHVRPTPARIEADFAAREVRGRERYLDSSPEMAALWQQHGIGSLAQYCTSRIKYDPDRFAGFSADIDALLAERGWRRSPGT